MDARRWGLVISTLAYILGMAAQTTFVFFLVPTYAAENALGDAQTLAYVVNALAATAVGIAAGRLADRVPRRRVMRLGWSLEAAGALVLALGPVGTWSLGIGSALVGVGLSYGFVGFQSYVADLHGSEGLARAYGVTGALAVLGGAAGPFLAGRVLAASGMGAAAYSVAVMGVLAFLLTLPLRRARRHEHPPPVGPRVGFAAAALFAFDPRGSLRGTGGGDATAYLVAFAILGLGYGLTAPWMGPHLLEAHALAPDALGTLVAIATLAGAIGIFVAGRLGERRDRALGLALAANALLAITLVGFAFAPTLQVAALLFVGRHLVGNATGPILHAGIVRATPPERRGRALGATNLAWNLPWAAGALAGGAMLTRAGAEVFLAGAALVALGPLAGLAMRRYARGDSSGRASAGSTRAP